MRILTILTALCVVGLVSDLRAQMPPMEKPDPDLVKLVNQLGDEDQDIRDKAMAKLKAAGLKALPALRLAVEHEDAEVKRRVQELLPELELAAFVMPKRVTFKPVNKPLQEIIQEINKQTGYQIQCFNPNPNQTYSFDFVDATFWDVVDRMCRDAGLALQQSYGDQIVRLQHVDGYAPYVTREGAFRFVANGFEQRRHVDLNLAKRIPVPTTTTETLTFTFTVCAEPKLPLLGMGDVKLLAAYDSERNTMLPPAVPINENDPQLAQMRGRFSSGRFGGNRSLTQQTSVQLVRTSEKATSVKSLRGTIPVNLLVKQEPVVVAEKVLDGKGKKQKYGSVTVNIEEVMVQANKQVQVKMSISEENHGGDYSWMNQMYQRFELYDSKGAKYSNYGSGWSSSGPATTVMTLNFGGLANDAVPGKLIFSHWTTLQYNLFFEFKDLPLP